MFLLLGNSHVSAQESLLINKSNPFFFYAGEIKQGDILKIQYTAGGDFNGARILVISEGVNVFSGRQNKGGLQNIELTFQEDFYEAAIMIEPFSGNTTHKLHSVFLNDEEIDIFNPPQPPENYPYIPGLLNGLTGDIVDENNNVIDQSNLATDRNTFTNVSLKKRHMISYELDEPKRIYAYMLNTSSANAYLQLLDPNLNILYDHPVNEVNSKRVFSLDNINNVKFVRVIYKADRDPIIVRDVELYGDAQTVPEEIKSITIDNVTSNSIKVSFEYEKDVDFSHVELSINDIGTFKTTGNSYTFKNLTPDTSYTIIASIVNTAGMKSNPVNITARTLEAPPPDKEVKNLQAKPRHNRVDLSWENPSYEGFHHVRIYRKNNANNRTPFMKFLFGAVVYADDDFKPIFETNGTYFNDLTVEPEKTYEYKLTTSSIDGLESEGVTIQVTTLPEPPPEMGGVEQEEDENGDYVFKWTSPTEGTVKILVGGEEYATVPASDGRITIPKDDMKYTPLGNPDVRLVPISESGKEGSPTYPGTVGGGGSIKIPFTPKDVLTSAVQLFGVVGPFLFLILAIYVTRVYLIPLIRKSASKREVREGRRFRT